MQERLIGKQIESCILGALQARSEEHLKHHDRCLLFEQLLFLPKKNLSAIGEDSFGKRNGSHSFWTSGILNGMNCMDVCEEFLILWTMNFSLRFI